MPTDYAVHRIGYPISGNHPPAPSLPASGGQKSLADNTDSALITITQPSVLIASSTAKVRLDLQACDPANVAVTIPALAPTNSPVVLFPEVPRIFSLAQGQYLLKTLAYA